MKTVVLMTISALEASFSSTSRALKSPITGFTRGHFVRISVPFFSSRTRTIMLASGWAE
jgi:hypothetical protein